MFPVEVVTPAIFTLSKFVWPSTSMSPDISKLVAVTTPAMLTLSKFVCPSTDISLFNTTFPVTSILPVVFCK